MKILNKIKNKMESLVKSTKKDKNFNDITGSFLFYIIFNLFFFFLFLHVLVFLMKLVNEKDTQSFQGRVSDSSSVYSGYIE